MLGRQKFYQLNYIRKINTYEILLVAYFLTDKVEEVIQLVEETTFLNESTDLVALYKV